MNAIVLSMVVTLAPFFRHITDFIMTCFLALMYTVSSPTGKTAGRQL